MHRISSIKVTGPDAFDFLQGQLSNDLTRLETDAEIFAAWCTPKGRVLWFGTVVPIENGYELSAPSETADDIVKRLSVFRFRAKVDFEIADDSATVDAETLVNRGHPFISTLQMDKFTPHMLNLDLLGAISYDKGCYTGQEIVARTHYKGATKRRMQRFQSEQPVRAGDRVSLDGRDIGEVLNVAGTDLLAVVPVAKSGAALAVGETAIALAPLPYALTTQD
ncbi:MAG: hypothetical protein K0U72_00170 [Gammaproteobacteria bacterium]|nr:hypothetical protein [Gammaproteobacteria bacterium]